MITEAVIGVIGAVVGSVITNYFKGVAEVRKVAANEELAQNQQAILLYREMYDKVNSTVTALEKDVDELQKNNWNCREELILLKERTKNCK